MNQIKMLNTFSVLRDVFLCDRAESLADFFDDFIPPISSHAGDGKAGMAPRSIPVSLHWLGTVRHLSVQILGDAVHDVTSHVQMVAHLSALARSDLEFPLTCFFFRSGIPTELDFTIT